MQTYKRYFPINTIHEEPALVIKPDELIITPEQIEIQQTANTGDLKNISRDENDKREKSYENWQENLGSNNNEKSIEQSIHDYEKGLFEEAGGEIKREKIIKEMELRKESRNNETVKSQNKTTKNGSNTAYAGNVMVSFSLQNRSSVALPHGGYTCGHGSSGRVVVQIKVNQNGNVTEASVLSSSGGNSCMTEQSLKYAKKSKFNLSNTISSSQIGTITYTYVPQ